MLAVEMLTDIALCCETIEFGGLLLANRLLSGIATQVIRVQYFEKISLSVADRDSSNGIHTVKKKPSDGVLQRETFNSLGGKMVLMDTPHH